MDQNSRWVLSSVDELFDRYEQRELDTCRVWENYNRSELKRLIFGVLDRNLNSSQFKITVGQLVPDEKFADMFSENPEAVRLASVWGKKSGFQVDLSRIDSGWNRVGVMTPYCPELVFYRK